jgi:hypothetical protein
MNTTAKRTLAVLLTLTLILSLTVTAFAVSAVTLDSAVNDAAAYMLRTVSKPEVGSVGGEWAVIGLVRSGYDVPDSYYANYYKTVEQYVKDCKGVLHEKKYTEYSRVILGLTSAGYDPRNVGGYDLTAPLSDFDKTVWQGINGPIWALIALDSGNYACDIRQKYVDYILEKQTSDGGWALSGNVADPDMTGMALTALANYLSQDKVQTAIDNALKISFKYPTSEGVCQLLVAYAALGENTDALVAELLKYRQSDGSFVHVLDSKIGENQMATEQAFYALVAAQRAANGDNSLYDMSDTTKRGEFAPTAPNTSGLKGKNADVKPVAVVSAGTTFADISKHANKAAIEALAARGIINGKSDTAFDPDATMTRAEFSKTVVGGLGLPQRADSASAFTDVPAKEWYAGYVGAAYFYEITTGATATTFNPNGTITRQEAAVMVTRAAKLAGLDTAQFESSVTLVRDTLAQFGDYTKSADWARESLAFCYANGIWDDTEFDIKPSEEIKRCEIAEMLYRMLKLAELQ